MSHYSKDNIGKISNLHQYVFAPEGTPVNLTGKVFLGDILGLTSMEVSLNKDAPGTGIDFFHSHKRNEELYIFLEGRGEMIVGDDKFDIEEGSVVRVSTGVKRAWWNTGKDDLYYVVVQAQTDGLETSKLNDAEIVNDQVPWV